LETFEGRVNRPGQGPDGEGFCEARHAFQQNVAIGEHGDEHAVDQFFLSDEDPVQFGPDLWHPGGGDGDTFGKVRRSVGHGEKKGQMAE